MMETTVKKSNSELRLDKSQWTLTKFGDVAIQQKVSVDREKTDLSKYVKGEHMGSEDIHLRSWGELTDEYLGPAFIRYFEKGDILYGSRRTYLKKVVVAPFEGITANTTFVIKPNEEVIDKRLLPFLMLSDGFSDHSIRNSKGSVNPYVNWKDLANYEFLLPPKDQQARLAELLWAMDAVVEGEIIGAKSAQILLNSSIESSYKKLTIKNTYPLKDVLRKITAGVSVNNKKETPSKDDVLVLKTSAITGEYFLPQESKTVLESEICKLKGHLRQGTILLNRKNTPELVGRVKYITKDYPNIYLPDLIWELEANQEIVIPQFLSYYLASKHFRMKINSIYSGTSLSMVNISQKRFLGLEIKLPTKTAQVALLKDFSIIEDSIHSFQSKLTASRALQKSLINQIF